MQARISLATFAFGALLLFPLTGIAQAGATPGAPVSATLLTLDGRSKSRTEIDTQVRQLMAANRVPGLALALIREGQVAFVGTYGQRDVEKHLPVTPDTVFYGASLTKATFATLVMQLVGEGKLDLDKSIAEFLPKALPDYPNYADLQDDPRWKALTLSILLDHTSGFQNFRWIDSDKKLRFHRDPGTRYGYSGEGINLAQFVIETALAVKAETEMQRRIFDRYDMTRTSMTWRNDFADDVAIGYADDGAPLGHAHRSRARAAGSMDTTISDWSRFLAAVARGDGLTPASWTDMLTQQIAIDSPRQFPTLLPEKVTRYKGINLGYGLGWGVFETRYGKAFFKEGHDDGAANYALCIAEKQSCILLLSNSTRAEGIFLPLVDFLMGPTGLPADWEAYIPYDQAK